jgi:hypothetical protein
MVLKWTVKFTALTCLHFNPIGQCQRCRSPLLQHFPSGYGVHWPEIDEDLTIDGLIASARLAQPKESAENRCCSRKNPPQISRNNL